MTVNGVSAVGRPPEIGRAGVGITVRRVGSGEHARTVAGSATRELGRSPWPDGLLSWSVFTSTDVQSAMVYEQWRGDSSLDAAVDAALAGAAAAPHVPGIPGTERSTPVRHRLYRSHADTAPGEPAVPGCIAIPVFETAGPERQRHFVEELFALTEDSEHGPAGLISVHLHLTDDGTRVVNYAEWTGEQAPVEVVGAQEGDHIRRRISGGIPGVRSAGYRRWQLDTSLVTA